jgi:hypothetical protein
MAAVRPTCVLEPAVLGTILHRFANPRRRSVTRRLEEAKQEQSAGCESALGTDSVPARVYGCRPCKDAVLLAFLSSQINSCARIC